MHELHDSASRLLIYSPVGKDISYAEPSVASLAYICCIELVLETLAGDELLMSSVLIFLSVSRLTNMLFLFNL